MTLPAGPMVSKAHVTAAVVDMLREWLPFYIAEACRAHELAADALPAPVSWQKLPNLRANNQDQYPAGVVTSPGTAGVTYDDEGNVQLVWRVQVILLVRGQSFDEVERNTAIYALAARTCAVQQGTLGDLQATTTFTSELYDVLDPTAARSLGAVQVDLEVAVPDVLNVQDGPRGEPPADPLEPPDDDPQAASVHVLEEPLVHPAFE